jgi:hypothetical protein
MTPGQPPLSDGTDGSTSVRSLLAAVHRRLWRERFVVALRVALWSWAAILASAAALHLAVSWPGLGVAVAIAGAAGLAALGWAALRRPSEAESALYADRRLGGESAYSTWLEARAGGDDARNTPALRRLAQWTAAAARRSQGALEALHAPLRLARPFVAATICTVVAALVTALPAADRRTDTDRARQAREPSQATEPLSLDDDGLARELAAELSMPLESPVGSEDLGRGSMQRARDGEGATSAATAGESSTVQAAVPRDDVRRATAAKASIAAAGVEATAGLPPTADEAGEDATARAPGSGREAGTSRDALAAAAGSRALPGALAVQRRDVIDTGEDSARQADMGQAGIYDRDTSASRAAAALPEVAAARPPAARREIALTPAEAAFVTAWAESSRAMRSQPR